MESKEGLKEGIGIQKEVQEAKVDNKMSLFRLENQAILYASLARLRDIEVGDNRWVEEASEVIDRFDKAYEQASPMTVRNFEYLKEWRLK